MNPNENNPISPTGVDGATSGAMGSGMDAMTSAGGVTSAAGGATSGGVTATSTTPSSVDFTSAGATDTTSSLAVDNNTTAGDALTGGSLAGGTLTGGAADAGSEQNDGAMTVSAQPLTPADPVPGSLGSVTSGAALTDANSSASGAGAAPDTSALNMGAGADTTPVTPGVANPFAPAADTTPAANPFAAPTSGSDTSATGTDATTGSTKPVQPYYNPFARTQGGNSAGAGSSAMGGASSATSGFGGASGLGGASSASSTNVPPALQPQTEKFSDRLGKGEKKSGGMMHILGWVLAAVFAVLAVIFAVLWMGAKDQKEIVYIKPDPEPVEQVIARVSCTQNLGAELVDGLENLSDHRRELLATFTNNALSTISLKNVYTFADLAAAEAARPYFETQDAWYAEVANNLGVEPVVTTLTIPEENGTLWYEMEAIPESLTGDYATAFFLPVAEDGSVDTTTSGAQQAFESVGFVCTVE